MPSLPIFLVLRWAPGADAVDRRGMRNGVPNVWHQPLSSGPRRQVTDFTPGLIFNSTWPSGGGKLLLARGSRTPDVLLIRNFAVQVQ
jgi:hypothetical protein